MLKYVRCFCTYSNGDNEKKYCDIDNSTKCWLFGFLEIAKEKKIALSGFFKLSLCMHIGLTQLDPKMEALTSANLPQYALPDLANMGTSWVFPITKYVNGMNERFTNNDPPNNAAIVGTGESALSANSLEPDAINNIGEGFFIRTSRGIISRNILKPVSHDGSGTDILPTDSGTCLTSFTFLNKIKMFFFLFVV